jgi:uncharacterized protein (DUF58 family)
LNLVVYPRTIAVPVAMPGMAKDIEGKPTGQPSDADISFHALRDYEAGDDRRSIHWRSTARLGKLMVRQSEDARRVQLALIVSTEREEYAREKDFEIAVGAYASLGLAELDSSGEVAVAAGGGVLEASTDGRGALLDHSAGITLQPRARGGVSLASSAAMSRREVPRATLAILVTGTVSSVHDLQRVAQFLPREAKAIAVRCHAGADLELTQVGRLGVVTVGSLDDLPRALRRLGMS